VAHDKSVPILQNLAANENKMHLSSLCEHLIFPSLSLPEHTRTHTHTHAGPADDRNNVDMKPFQTRKNMQFQYGVLLPKTFKTLYTNNFTEN